jgi:prepilin-type N-terminal cleavage/methylation domain-containing protein
MPVSKLVRKNMRGDTLVEVMMSMAVVGMVIGVSYSIANRSARAGRIAQEQTEALKLTESQIELVKAAAENPLLTSAVFPASGSPYCVTVDPVTDAMQVVASSNAGCLNRGTANRYNVQVKYTNAGGQDNFLATTSWESLSGPTTVKIAYRIHP